MAADETKQTLQQAYISEKANATGKKGTIRIKDSDVVWDKLGDFIEAHDITAEFFMSVAFKEVKNPYTIFPNMLLSAPIKQAVLQELEESETGSELLDEFDELRMLMLHSCIMETGQADMGDVRYKKALWEGMYDGYDPFTRFITIYPQMPERPSILTHPLVKDALRRAYFVIRTKPEVKIICKEMNIDYSELVSWEAFDAIK